MFPLPSHSSPLVCFYRICFSTTSRVLQLKSLPTHTRLPVANSWETTQLESLVCVQRDCSCHTLEVCLPQAHQRHPEQGVRQVVQWFVQILAFLPGPEPPTYHPVHSSGGYRWWQHPTSHLLKNPKATHRFSLEGFVKVIMHKLFININKKKNTQISGGE